VTVDKFIVNYGTIGAGFNELLLVKEEFLLGVNVAVFFGPASLLERESINLIISLESIWYYMSNDVASRLLSFF
jgi:hypothetical protein